MAYSKPPTVLKTKRFGSLLRALAALLLAGSFVAAFPQETSNALQITRTARPWEFLCAVGTRAGIFGNESGRVEAWVYPLKILRDFHLQFHTEGRVLPAESLTRTVTVRPESTTVLYTSDTFAIRETFLVPVDQAGAVILLDVETEQPLEVEAAFHRDFQLEWPAALGATYGSWDAAFNAFYLGEEQKKFAALVGSPTATDPHTEFEDNYSSSHENSFRLGVTKKGKETKLIVIAASVENRAEAENIYRRLSSVYKDSLRDSAEYYRDYLAKTVSLELPDAQLQQAYDWSRISMLQGMVSNPYLGKGLVAGYRTSGESQRPGFAWFFGRDSLWTSLALDAEGDFTNTRTALQFISKYQREDGKIPHEIAQGASFVPWFKEYPYPYASADATPLYIIVMNDYVVASGDTAFATEKWDSLAKAYQFLRSTYDAQGFPQNFGFGHGWVEGGPLLPVKTEFYQSGLGTEVLRALANLARLTGKIDLSNQLAKDFVRQQPLLNQAFWLPDKKRFAFALDKDNHPVDEPTVLATVPMWFELLDQDKTDAMITQLADLDNEADWGMRIISANSPEFSGGGYHYGAVWPLFTGWASVGEYRYHRVHSAYANLRANALLALDGSPGHVTEVLSGDYYQSLSTSSPHQIWSAAMVVSPILKGMLGIKTNAASAIVTLAPHIPASWTTFAIHNVHAGTASVDFRYAKTADTMTLEVINSGSGECVIEFQPAVSLRAEVPAASLNGHSVPFHLQANALDQHVMARFSVPHGTSTLQIRLRDDFGVAYNAELPPLGSVSQGLRILSETWTPARDRLALAISGIAGHAYELSLWNPTQIESVDGAKVIPGSAGSSKLSVLFPLRDHSDSVAHSTITFHFIQKQKNGDSQKR
ncbi:MAG TPA: hypothetical protein VOA64_12930 [Candidatus Dormibacteraeota bacterium]|nr:hypothetical protein [Candidatus Dormibacteraeota bacterium]